MSRGIHDDRKVLARMRRIRGQAGARERAVAQEAGCSAVLQQIAAIRGAVNGLLTAIPEGQLHEHAVSSVTAKRHHVEHKHLLRLLRVCLK